jgi:magnesium chelatase family protein
MDRIDLHVEVPQVPYEELSGKKPGSGSSEIRAQVLQARAVQQQRFEGSVTSCNAAMSDKQLQTHCRPEAEAEQLLRNAVDALVSAPAVTVVS